MRKPSLRSEPKGVESLWEEWNGHLINTANPLPVSGSPTHLLPSVSVQIKSGSKRSPFVPFCVAKDSGRRIRCPSLTLRYRLRVPRHQRKCSKKLGALIAHFSFSCLVGTFNISHLSLCQSLLNFFPCLCKIQLANSSWLASLSQPWKGRHCFSCGSYVPAGLFFSDAIIRMPLNLLHSVATSTRCSLHTHY